MRTPFFKMTGSGNDFVMLDGRLTTPEAWPVDRIVRTCDRRHGAGADGLVILSPAGVDAVRMSFFNSDGTRAAMCGNAALCSTRLSALIGLAPSEGMTLVTDAGTYDTRCIGPGHRAEVHLSDFELPAPVTGLAPESGERCIMFRVVGVPHLVIRVGDVNAVDLARRGWELRHHAAVGPAGANANFVSPPAEAGRPWLIRTFERGVEGETLACGTGTVASAVAMAALGEAQLPMTFVSRGGVELSVAGVIDGGMVRDVWLCGEGRLVYEGVLTE
jgi:diaminopimelate epimerase